MSTDNSTLSLLMSIGDYFLDCFTIVEMMPDAQVCLYVNQEFIQHTGYSTDDTLGKNLNFLQGPDTSPKAIDIMHKAFAESLACCTDVLNYRKDGSKFMNRLVMLPMIRGEHRYYIGFQNVLGHPFIKESHRSHGEINHVLNNLLSTLFMSVESDLLRREPVDERLSEIGNIFTEINTFCRGVDDLAKFESYNPFT